MAPPADEPPAPPPLSPELTLFEGAYGRTRGAELQLVGLEVTSSDASVRVRLDVLGRPDRVMRHDGLSGVSRGLVARRGDAQLFLPDGSTFPAEVVRQSLTNDAGDRVPDALITSWVVPYEAPQYAVTQFSFELPKGTSVDDLGFRLTFDDGLLELPVRGHPHGPDQVTVVALDPSGRPPVQPGALTWTSGSAERGPHALPWVGAADAGEATLSVAGFEPVVVRLGPAGVVEVPLVPADALGAREARFAALWDLSGRIPTLRDAVDVHARLDDVEARRLWVRDHVGIVGTHGIQRSPDAVVRWGAGSPIERAILLRKLLEGIGIRSRTLCGDLPPEEAAELYAGAVPVGQPEGPLRAWMEPAQAAVGPVSEAMARVLSQTTDLPTPLRSGYRLVPEWCWVERVMDDRSVVELDIRPAALQEEPEPFRWRSTDQIGPDAFGMSATLWASMRQDGQLQDVALAQHVGSALSIDDNGLVFDLFPAARRGEATVHTAVVRDRAFGARLQREIRWADVETMWLEVSWKDPVGVATTKNTLPLYERARGRVPQAMRVMLTVDTGSITAGRVAEVIRRAVTEGHPDPGAAAMRAQQFATSWLRQALVDGVPPAEPVARITLAEAYDDAFVTRTDVSPPPTPAWWREPPGEDARMRYAAADAVARAVASGRTAPTPPAQPAEGDADLSRFRHIDTETQLAIVRGAGQYRFWVGEDGTLWRVEPQLGGVAWFDAAGQAQPLPVAEPPDAGARWPLTFWDLPLRCAVARPWAAAVGVDVPEACTPPPEVTPTGAP